MSKALRLSALAVAAGFLLSGCEQNSTPPPPATKAQPAFAGTIVAVGDSLTAGYGVNEADAYPARLEKKLHAAGFHWRVVNAGISGETSSGTLSRVAWVLKLKPDIVILDLNLPKKSGFEVLEEIGRSDALQKFPVVIFSSSSRNA